MNRSVSCFEEEITRLKAEVERLLALMHGKKMLKTACPGCGDIINLAQAALGREEKP